jgi:hypothetical protein
MAEISITVDEVYKYAKEFDVVPEKLKSVQARRDDIITVVDLSRFLPEITFTLNFDSFRDGKAYFEIKSPGIAKLPLGMLKKPINLSEDIVKIDKRNLVIDIGRAIEGKVGSIRIKDVEFNNEVFKIKF